MSIGIVPVMFFCALTRALCNSSFVPPFVLQASVVQKLDNAIYQINRYPPFEQMGPVMYGGTEVIYSLNNLSHLHVFIL